VAPTTRSAGIIETDIPPRLDRLPWSRFHSLVVLTLGITWILDGLEVTLAGAVSGALKLSPTLQLSDAQVGATASAYLAGAVLGALFFGWLADRLGRRRLFFITLGVYALATGATAFANDFASFALFRFLTGAGIGGEYAAINSAIQELIPARFRGRTDLAINGSFWVGAMLGSLGCSCMDASRKPNASSRISSATRGPMEACVLSETRGPMRRSLLLRSDCGCALSAISIVWSISRSVCSGITRAARCWGSCS
jgi:hypothetical protein